MIELGVKIEHGTVPEARFWLASADSIADPAVFLVRAGRVPVMARVCRPADFDNWPAEETDGFGWYRSAGISRTIHNSEDARLLAEMLRTELAGLDSAMGSPEDPETRSESLRYGRSGEVFGSLQMQITRRASSLLVDFLPAVSDTALAALMPDGLFVESGGELSRVLSPADGFDGGLLASGESLSDTLTAHVDESALEALVTALVEDIEDFCTYLALRDGMAVI